MRDTIYFTYEQEEAIKKRIAIAIAAETAELVLQRNSFEQRWREKTRSDNDRANGRMKICEQLSELGYYLDQDNYIIKKAK